MDDSRQHPAENRRFRRRWRLARAATALFLLLASGCYLAREPLLVAAARLVTVETSLPPRVDYIVPLGGGAETRPFRAAELHRQYPGATVLVFRHVETGAVRSGLVAGEPRLYRRVLEFQGVPASAITTVPDVVRDTRDEARAVRRLLPAGRPSTIVVVTTPEHTRRALWAFRNAMSGLPVDVRVAAARNLRFDERNWWRDDEGVVQYTREYLKLPYYWLRSLLTRGRDQ